MSSYDPQRPERSSRARDRQNNRARNRDEAMAVPRASDATTNSDPLDAETPVPPRQPAGRSVMPDVDLYHVRRRADLMVKDALWYMRYRPVVWQIGGAAILAIFAIFALSYVLPGRIFPNVYAMGVPLGGLTVEEATAALDSAWASEIRIEMVMAGEIITSVRPTEIGLYVDSRAAAEAAKGAGLSGIPMGLSITPKINLSFRTAEDYLVARAVDLNRPALNASYSMRDGIAIGVPGETGREIDIIETLQVIDANPAKILNDRRVDVISTPLQPDFPDPEPYLMEVRRMTAEPFTIQGYDPFTDTSTTWATPPENVVKWFEAGADGLQIRTPELLVFLEALNMEIARTDPVHYFARDDAIELLQRAVNQGELRTALPFRSHAQSYTVQRGDSGYRIARRTGIPYFMIAEANAGRDLGTLFPGDEIILPSKDEIVALPPVPEKRIVVDIETQTLYGFENGQQIFSWLISTGIDEAPTSPGVYQVRTHDEIAFGSSFTLCSNDVCGQWKMYWFMGIYEVTPGLMNGFHGAVELPNGAYLGGGSVGSQYTFGCVMSQQDEAKRLYDWADQGVIVEIISREFEATSNLGRVVQNLRGQQAFTPAWLPS
jgi:lipoprotein-anchoring transpeptidase ErfK/SrfK